MEEKMKRNIQLLYIYRFIRAFIVVIAVLVPFFQERGLSQSQIFALQSIFAVAILLLEVPSGYFADVVGRKKSLVVGAIVLSTAFSLYIFAYGFWPLLFVEALLGVGYSFISGADDALAYESLKAIHKEAEYKQVEARSVTLTSIAEATASALGGALALISLRTPIVVEFFVQVLLVPVALMLVEPPHSKKVDGNPFRDVVRITKYALHDHSEVKWLIFYGAVVGTVTHTMVWLTQPYYQLSGVPLGWFGVLWAVQLLAMAWFARYTVRYEAWLGKRKALISFPVIGVVAYVLMGVLPAAIGLVFILGFYFVRGVHMPILKHYVNDLIESDVRATVLSVKNLAQKLLYAGLGPLIGVVVDAYSLRVGLLFSAAIYGLLGLIVLAAMRRRSML